MLIQSDVIVYVFGLVGTRPGCVVTEASVHVLGSFEPETPTTSVQGVSKFKDVVVEEELLI